MSSSYGERYGAGSMRGPDPSSLMPPARRTEPPFSNNMDINVPMPAGIEERIRQLQKMRGPVNPPNRFEFFAPPPGQGPRQVAPDPQPEPQMPLRSVLRRDNMG